MNDVFDRIQKMDGRIDTLHHKFYETIQKSKENLEFFEWQKIFENLEKIKKIALEFRPVELKEEEKKDFQHFMNNFFLFSRSMPKDQFVRKAFEFLQKLDNINSQYQYRDKQISFNLNELSKFLQDSFGQLQK